MTRSTITDHVSVLLPSAVLPVVWMEPVSSSYQRLIVNRLMGTSSIPGTTAHEKWNEKLSNKKKKKRKKKRKKKATNRNITHQRMFPT
jgi:hypothetical protein